MQTDAQKTRTRRRTGPGATSAAPRANAASPAPGPSPASAPRATILGRYRVIEACGTGGFGTVLTCWDTRLQRRVAIKRIPTPAAAPTPAHAAHAATTPLAAALAEARTASLLAHPNIVAVFDFEPGDACAYLVMEHVNGITLAELLRRVEGGALTGDEAAHIVASVAGALAYAHDNGVLHLDLKPTNIMIDATGTVKLCDFGMATLASAAGYGGARGGTVGYMPPEQVTGELVDERSDVYSLAVVTWQMLAGANPFAAAGAEASLKLMRKGPTTSLADAAPGIAPAVDDVMEVALSYDPSGRFTSVGEFAERLTGVLGDAGAGARSVARLLAQATSDEGETTGENGALPVAFRYPWLAGALTRGAAALTTSLATYAPAAALLGAEQPAAAPVAATAAGALAALWPPAGSMLALLSLLAAIAHPPTSAAAVMLAGVGALAAVGWWLGVAKRDPHATTALLAPIALAAPAAAPALAGLHLPPLRAAVTAQAAWLAARLHAAAVAAGFDAPVVAHALAALPAAGATWVALAGVGGAAAATAALTRVTASHAGTVAAQVVGATVVVGTQLAAAAMENGGHMAPPTWPSVGVAVCLCVIMSVVSTIYDEATADEEGA